MSECEQQMRCLWLSHKLYHLCSFHFMWWHHSCNIYMISHWCHVRILQCDQLLKCLWHSQMMSHQCPSMSQIISWSDIYVIWWIWYAKMNEHGKHVTLLWHKYVACYWYDTDVMYWHHSWDIILISSGCHYVRKSGTCVMFVI
jgi:hypothetical protein